MLDAWKVAQLESVKPPPDCLGGRGGGASLHDSSRAQYQIAVHLHAIPANLQEMRYIIMVLSRACSRHQNVFPNIMAAREESLRGNCIMMLTVRSCSQRRGITMKSSSISLLHTPRTAPLTGAAREPDPRGQASKGWAPCISFLLAVCVKIIRLENSPDNNAWLLIGCSS